MPYRCPEMETKMASIYTKINKNGSISYYCSININGKRHRKLLGYSNKAAGRNLKKLEYELIFNSNGKKEKKKYTLNQSIISFLNELEHRKLSRDYFNSIKTLLFSLKDYIKPKQYLNDVSTIQANDFFKIRQVRKHHNTYGSQRIHLSPIAHSTIKKELGYLNRFFNYCISNEWTDKNPFKHIKLPKQKPKEQRFYFKDEHLELIFKKIGKFSNFYAVMLHTGLRPTDAFKLAKKHISEGYLTIRMNKTKDLLNIPLSEYILDLLKPLLESLYDDNELLFPCFISERQRRNVRKFIQGLFPVDFVRKNNINLHTFRHTYAHTMLNKGVPKEVLQTLLGHRSIRTTEIYANWVRKEELEKWV